MAWSYAVRSLSDIKLYNALAYRAGQIMPKFKPRDLATLVRVRLGLGDVDIGAVGVTSWRA